jgi:hypothetical protein
VVEEPKAVPQNEQQTTAVFDENVKVKDSEKIPIHDPLRVLRYRTIKKNTSLGWWSAVVLLEDHQKKQVCFYRWRRKGTEWKRDKKIAFRTRSEWNEVKDAMESFIGMLV